MRMGRVLCAGLVAGLFLTVTTASWAVPPLPIKNVKGVIVDKQTKAALPGMDDPYAAATLYQTCFGSCFSPRATQDADANGRVIFVKDSLGNPLPPSSYVIKACADQYSCRFSASIEVAGGEVGNVRKVKLNPFPIVFSGYVPCAPVPADGGDCRFEFTASNTSKKPFLGRIWSIVRVGELRGATKKTAFQLGPDAEAAPLSVDPVAIGPGASEALALTFRVPGQVPDTAEYCPALHASAGFSAFSTPMGFRDFLPCEDLSQ